MKGLDIIIPVKDEAGSIKEISQRIDSSLKRVGIKYCMIFVDDNSTDSTVKEISSASKKYPIKLIHKRGKPGKAYSILEGVKACSRQTIAMIDGDLQYSPKYLPEMFHLMEKHGVVVANRKINGNSSLRKIGSKINSLIFGKILFGFNFDTQSGLKIFRKDIVRHIRESDVTAWTIDMPLLHTAVELGYSIGCVDIEFLERKKGHSKIHYAKAAYEIAKGSVKLRLKSKRVYPIKASNRPALGAGVIYKGKRYVTHTHLPHHESALLTLKLWQKVALTLGLITLGLGLLINAKITAIIFIAILTFIYFADLIFSTYVLLKSLRFPPEIKVSDKEVARLKEENLPVYTILCPLYKEAKVVSQFVESISQLDWPKDKLDVILLLEEDDEETRKAVSWLGYFSYVRTLIVPASQPKTKPKACNFGLAHARGEYVVVYDAEDRPDPLQLKKAYIAFGKTGSKVICLQSKLNYYNTNHNLLTRLFTAEYSLWFDLVLPGLQSIETSIPLGGTSNHFRTKDLKGLHAWDPFNVTEDCDLGVRLFKAGYKTAIIDSTTLEEANSNIKNWFRQRSRWIKGYLQTYLVHMRDPISFVKSQGIHALIFQLVIGMRMIFMLVNPILWTLTISYFVLYRFVGPAIEALYPAPIFYMAVTSLIFGNFMYFYNYMIGCAKREQWSLIKFVFLIPFYWLMMSIASGLAFYQLITKPHYWEKTHHGFHIDKLEKEKLSELKRGQTKAYRGEQLRKVKEFATSGFAAGGILVFATLIGNFFNFLYNAYLGRTLSPEQFGIIGLIGSFIYLVQIPSSGVGRTVTYKSAYLSGKFETPVKIFWARIRKHLVWISLTALLFWLISVPFLAPLFKMDDITPFLLFAPVWVFVLVGAVDNGFLTGNLKFAVLALTGIIEAVSKFAFTYLFVSLGLYSWIYAALPLSMALSFFIGWFVIVKIKSKPIKKEVELSLNFPKKFFGASILAKLSSVAFLSLDVILAKVYLPPYEAGQYVLLSLTGKMIFFFGTLFAQFITPLVSREVGAGKNPKRIFNKLLMATIFSSFFAYLVLGIFGNITVPLLLGQKALGIVQFLPYYAAGMVFFAVAESIVSYHMVRQHYLFPIVSFLLAIFEIVGIGLFHTNLYGITGVMVLLGTTYFVTMFIFHYFYEPLVIVGRNLLDLLGLFGKVPEARPITNKLRILIFNWRDTKHRWAGGAEVYIHELAKRWVKMGHEVTLFCGNDGHSARREVIGGVNIIRRGGFFMVYIWAFAYYTFRLKGKYDVIIDSENGIPFFTPLYAKEEKFLLIHHVHQDIFQVNLKPPLSWMGAFLEKRLMPIVYRNTEVITVSPSSKADILDHHLTEKEPYVIYNGVDLRKYAPGVKSKRPMVLYLGRIRTHKSLPIFVYAAKKVLKTMPKVRFVIAGEGQESDMLRDLIRKSGLRKKIEFLGKVSEERKLKLYQQAWVFVNPSLMEGWGITTIEANACGIPVVASNVSGLRDAIYNPHSGVLVPYGDVDEFAKNIKMLIGDNDLRGEMSRDAIRWAKKFDWEKSAKRGIEILKLHLYKKVE